MAIRELLEEDVEPVEGELLDELDVRRTMIFLAQQEAEREKVAKTRRAVVDSYDAKLRSIEERILELRRSVQAWIETKNDGEKVAFPDVGTAYLAEVDTKIEIVEKDEIPADLVATFTKRVDAFDATGFKAHALSVLAETGEKIAGTNVVPGGKDLRIRKAGKS